ncbi:hypothetical protein C8N46_101808 [Kordia periserrulae]|uniref:Carboxypeptidase-like protein n=2 Tax=Kordia periserrulae TaxID=701523 RepID=A0A2T6C7B8_9FLAO|nr:hypothetical protein C8N46_101808 [Kordia periserrulae]
MKNTYLKINKPCSERWENMTPNEHGSFCDVCAKNVIDFTKLSQAEITEKVQNSKGQICARLTKTQLETPLLAFEAQKTFKIPYSNVAASILLASTLAVSTVQAQQTEKTATEFVQHSNTLSSKSNFKRKQSKPATKPSGFVTFTGTVLSDKEETPIENAKITLITLQKAITVYSSERGAFSMKIPTALLDDANVIRISYDEVNFKKRKQFKLFDTENYVLNREEISTNFTVKATESMLIMGGIGHYAKTNDPLVVLNGKEMSFKQLQKTAETLLENKEVYYFESDFATAIYGKEIQRELYIILDKPTK